MDSASSCVDGVSALGEGLRWRRFEGVGGGRISPQVRGPRWGAGDGAVRTVEGVEGKVKEAGK